MKLTLGEGRGMVMGLNGIMGEKLPSKTAYWFARSLRELSGHMEDLEKARQTLLDKYAKKDRKGKFIEKKNRTYDMRDQEGFDKEFKELCDEEISIKYDGATLEQLGETQTCPHCNKEIPGPRFTAGNLFNLGKLIKEPTDGEEPKKEEEKTE